MSHARYRFGPFELDPGERTLARDGEDVGLQDLPFRLLAVLVERAPALVTRDQLRQALWPPDTHLDVDASLNTAVARVRDALGDEPGDPRFVATVPRRGYKLVAAVERIGSRPSPDKRWPIAAAVATLVVAGPNPLPQGERGPEEHPGRLSKTGVRAASGPGDGKSDRFLAGCCRLHRRPP